jgi:hypothetical protein
MLGMTAAKRQVALIRSTTKVNQARKSAPAGVGDLRHTLLVGPPGREAAVARALTKLLCGLGVLLPSMVRPEVKLVGRHLEETENTTRKLLDRALGGAVFLDEITTSRPRLFARRPMQDGGDRTLLRSGTDATTWWYSAPGRSHGTHARRESGRRRFRRPSCSTLHLMSCGPAGVIAARDGYRRPC